MSLIDEYLEDAAEKAVYAEKQIPGVTGGAVYALVNSKTGDIYVGQSWSLQNRWKLLRTSIWTNKRMAQDLQRYGTRGFVQVVLERGLRKQSEMNARERFWIKRLDSMKQGYNRNPGGSGGRRIKE